MQSAHTSDNEGILPNNGQVLLYFVQFSHLKRHGFHIDFLSTGFHSKDQVFVFVYPPLIYQCQDAALTDGPEAGKNL